VVGILKGKDDVNSVGNHRTLLECMFSSHCVNVDWIHIAYDRDRLRAAVNTVMKQGVIDWLNVGLSYTDTPHRTGSVFCRQNVVDDEYVVITMTHCNLDQVMCLLLITSSIETFFSIF